jgi:hypothetical protein
VFHLTYDHQSVTPGDCQGRHQGRRRGSPRDGKISLTYGDVSVTEMHENGEQKICESKRFGSLVSVSSTGCPAYTSDLSTW